MEFQPQSQTGLRIHIEKENIQNSIHSCYSTYSFQLAMVINSCRNTTKIPTNL